MVRICDFSDKVTSRRCTATKSISCTYRDSHALLDRAHAATRPIRKRGRPSCRLASAVIVSLQAAKDALYVETREGAVKRLLRRAWTAADAGVSSRRGQTCGCSRLRPTSMA